MAQLARIYGDVMQVRMGRDPWIVLSSPRAVHEAFVTKGGDFGGRPMVPSMSISSGGGKGFARPRPNPELKQLRRTAFTALFDPVRVRRSEEAFADETALLAEYLVGESERNGSAEIRPAVRRAVINCVLRYAFSTRIPHRAGEIGIVSSGNSDRNPPQGYFDELVHVTDKIWARLTSTQTTMADLLATPDVNSYELRRLVRRRDQIIREIVGHRQRQRRKDGDTHLRGEHGDMLDALLGAGLPETDVHDTWVDLFVAGVNTVRTQSEWFVLLLAETPSVQHRARGDVSSRPDAHPDARAVVQEVLRATPPLLLP